MKKFLEYLVSSLVKNPQDLVIKEEVVNDFIEFTIKVHPEDVKMVIGKHGQIIKAIRELVKVKAIKENKKVRIKIEESPFKN